MASGRCSSPNGVAYPESMLMAASDFSDGEEERLCARECGGGVDDVDEVVIDGRGADVRE